MRCKRPRASTRTVAPACPGAPTPPPVLTLLGWCARTAGPVTMAGALPCCGGCVRDCWLFSKDSRRAGRLFC